MSVGIWTFAFEGKEISAVREAAAEIEELGLDCGEAFGREAYTQDAVLTDSYPADPGGNGHRHFFRREPLAAAGAERPLAQAYPGRFLHGVGGHRMGAKAV